VSDTSVKDRRVHERFSTELSVQGVAGEPGVVARMVARNLSLGGLYCTSTKDFPEMTRLAVRLMLPVLGNRNGDTEPLDLEAVVVRREQLAEAVNGEARYEFALFFTQVGTEARSRLTRYLDCQ
jgi:hypothetical protein